MASPILERLRKQAMKELKEEKAVDGKAEAAEEKKAKAAAKKAAAEQKKKDVLEAAAEAKKEKAAAKKAGKGKTGVAAIKAAAKKTAEKKAGAGTLTLKAKEAAKKKAAVAKNKVTPGKKLKGTEVQTGAGFFYTQHLTSPQKEIKENIEGTPYYITNHGRVYSKKNNGQLKECVTLIYGRVPIADLRASGDRVRFKIADMIAEYFTAKQAKRFAELNNEYVVGKKIKKK